MKEIICGLCHNHINIKIESYVKVIDYKDGKFMMEGHYHYQCYHNLLDEIKNKRTRVLENMAFGLFGRAERIIKKQEENLGIEEQEVYEFKKIT